MTTSLPRRPSQRPVLAPGWTRPEGCRFATLTRRSRLAPATSSLPICRHTAEQSAAPASLCPPKSTSGSGPEDALQDGREVHQDDPIAHSAHGRRARRCASSVRGVPMVRDSARVRPRGAPRGDRHASRRGADLCEVVSDPFIPRRQRIPR